MSKNQAIFVCLLALACGVGGLWDLYHHIPSGHEPRLMSIWLILAFGCLMLSIYGFGNFMDITCPGWESNKDFDDL